MADIKHIKGKQDEKLKGKTDEEKALTAARRAMEEILRKPHLKILLILHYPFRCKPNISGNCSS